ncbi:MAG: sugar phosphate isomerase/epimerase family protein [Sedimentisphaerales bacterium]|jgi:sugar phosphate isomerase/epimerase|nr:sugar phosphate isomerase/epimerase family protein [Planctomycetota bacterium]MDY0355776.1 sugar phosphate isomerase/epimerase family protein [Sedimentisphaerales bacterium]NLT75381.1 sugar phosphate isomerase/epimerase [Planctomycetota bacterium]
MSQRYISRRDFVGAAGALLAGGRVSAAAGAQPSIGDGNRFRYCLNTSTIRGQKLGLAREVDVAAEAGYDAIEPWVSSLQEHTRSGGTLRDIRKRIEDRGLSVESAISFPRWIVDDDAVRAEAVEQVKREMDLLAQIGGKRIAAPPAGATDGAELDLLKAAERYRALLELGDQTGVVPQVEVWGPSKNLHRLGQSMFVVIESGHPKACLLPDVYHIYKGGSDFHGFKTISSRTIQVFHLNDYPANPPRATIRDGDRVMPGDGIAPLTQILRDLCNNGSEAVLSLELFSQVYWDKDPLAVAREGLAKMKAAVRAAVSHG